MLTGAGLSLWWPHDRAHSFFSRARWNAGDLGLVAAVLVVALLVPAGAPAGADSAYAGGELKGLPAAIS